MSVQSVVYGVVQSVVAGMVVPTQPAGGSNFNILTEDGSNLVAEDNSPIIQEEAP